MTLEHLARTIARARHGTDVMWANYMPSARAAVEELERRAKEDSSWGMTSSEVTTWLRALLAQPDGGQEGGG